MRSALKEKGGGSFCTKEGTLLLFSVTNSAIEGCIFP